MKQEMKKAHLTWSTTPENSNIVFEEKKLISMFFHNHDSDSRNRQLRHTHDRKSAGLVVVCLLVICSEHAPNRSSSSWLNGIRRM